MANIPDILEKIERLLDLHPDLVNLKIDKHSVIELACENSAVYSSIDIVKLLMRKGADVHRLLKGYGNVLTRTMKHVRLGTASEEVAVLLIDSGVNVNEYEDCGRLDSGYNPLLYAVGSNSERMVKILLEHGADADSEIYTDTCYDDYTTTSALEIALMKRKNTSEIIINLLLDNGYKYVDNNEIHQMLQCPNLSETTMTKLLSRYFHFGGNLDLDSNKYIPRNVAFTRKYLGDRKSFI